MSELATRIDIEDVPTAARAALAQAINEHRAPLAKPTGGSWIWLLILGCCALVGVLWFGFGEPYAGSQGAGSVFWYAAGFFGITWSVLLYRKRKALTALLGFKPGVYALGTRMIDARTRVLGSDDLFQGEPKIVHRYVNGGYRQTTLTWHGHVFSFGRQPLAGQALQAISTHFQALRAAAQASDLDQLLRLDPMAIGLSIAQDANVPKPVRGPAKPEWHQIAIGLAIVAVLTPGTFFLRNYLSMEAAFGNIHSTYECEAWMRNGGDSERGHVRMTELDMQEVLSQYPDRADKLREVLEKYPDAPANVKAPVEAALKTRYETTRKAALALSASEQLTWFINQVYDRLESTGAKATMHIEIERTEHGGLERLDSFVAADAKLKKVIVPVAKYFDTSDEMSRTASLKTAIQDGMAQFFPADVMVFADAADKDTPEIEIFYVVRPQLDDDGTPSTYSEIDANDKPIPGSLEYPGIEFELGATLKVPNAPGEAHKVTFTARPSPTISVQRTSPRVTATADLTSTLDNSAVYHAMADSAFADLRQKLVVALGGKVDKTKPAADDQGPTDPACVALEDSVTAMKTCKTVAAGEKDRVLAAMKKLFADPNITDIGATCAKASEIVDKTLAKSKCAKPAPAAPAAPADDATP